MRTLVDNYRDWLNLGPGGLPANPVGWVITTALRPLGRDPMTVRGIRTAPTPAWDLPVRSGPRPPVAPFPIPHRQTADVADDVTTSAISEVVESCAADRRMFMQRSHFERRGQALFVREGFRTVERVKTARGEIAHVHSGDGSLHVVADPADAQLIIEQGWGELHPLAGRPLLGLPESYVLLYSPRNDEDLRQLSTIVRRVVSTAMPK
ncbi:luciferase domain-containing protein [Rhodococcoides trifolii]|uniref:luciferase domain-containing protein n=1 Tax=Rhodococcoides trifolii TaxID=908250 RepID=UPI00166EE195|nr:luciferase family protein [Rhodococcus trifolii]